jgi:hypothetical protein
VVSWYHEWSQARASIKMEDRMAGSTVETRVRQDTRMDMSGLPVADGRLSQLIKFGVAVDVVVMLPLSPCKLKDFFFCVTISSRGWVGSPLQRALAEVLNLLDPLPDPRGKPPHGVEGYGLLADSTHLITNCILNPRFSS